MRKIETLWTGELPEQIALNSSGIYVTYTGAWSMSEGFTGRVFRVPYSGGPATLLAQNQPQPYGLTATADSVYWATSNNTGTDINNITRFQTSGDSPSILYENDNLYWLVVSEKAVIALVERSFLKIPLSGLAPTELVTSTSGKIASAAADENNLYWSEWPGENGADAGIKKISLSGGTPEVLATGLDSPSWLISDGTRLFWRSGRHTVLSIPAAGGQVTTVATDLNIPANFAFDKDSLYWVGYELSESEDEIVASQIKKVPKTGGTPDVVVKVANKAISLAVDDKHAYWSEWPFGEVGFSATGWVRRVEK